MAPAAPGAQVCRGRQRVNPRCSLWARWDALLATHIPLLALPLPSFIYAQVPLLFGTLSQPLVLLS